MEKEVLLKAIYKFIYAYVTKYELSCKQKTKI